MPLAFYDTDDDQLPSKIRAAGVAGVPSERTVRFECRDGNTFSATSISGAVVEARLDGDTDWIDIVSSPIDVSPYAPATSDFNVRITPPAEGVYDIVLRVGPPVITYHLFLGTDRLVLDGDALTLTA